MRTFKDVNRTWAALLTSAVVCAGAVVATGVTAQPAYGQTAACTTSVNGAVPRPGSGDGTLSTGGPGRIEQVVPGGLITIVGTGFADRPIDTGALNFLINDGSGPEFFWPPQSAAVGSDATGDGRNPTVKMSDHMRDGAFSVSMRLPDTLSPGCYWIRVLGGSGDGGATVSKSAWFEVVRELPSDGGGDGDGGDGDGGGDGGDGSPQPPSSAASLTADAVAIVDDHTEIDVTASGFPAGAALQATLAGAPVPIAGASGATTNVDGEYQGVVTVPAGRLRAGERAWLEVSSDDMNRARTRVTGTPRVTLTDPRTNGPMSSLNSHVQLTVSNLVAGARVTGIGTGTANWLSSPITANSNGVATASVTISDGVAGSPISVTVEHGARTATYPSGLAVAPAQGPVNDNQFAAQSVALPAPPDAVAIDNKSHTIVTSSTTTGGATLQRFDLDTLAPRGQERRIDDAQFTSLVSDDDNRTLWALDTTRGRVTVLGLDDLEVQAAFAVPGASAIQLDTTTHRAYIAVQPQPNADGTIAVFDAAAPRSPQPLTPIALVDFGAITDMEIDPRSGDLFVTSGRLPREAQIPTRHPGAPVIYNQRNSPRAFDNIVYDPDRFNIWVSSTDGEGDTVVDVNKNAVVTQVFGGSGVTQLRYDPTRKVIYEAAQHSKTISVFDGTTLEFQARLALSEAPADMVVTANGTVIAITADDSRTAGTLWTFRHQPTAPDPGFHNGPVVEGSLGGSSDGSLTDATDLGSTGSSDRSPIPVLLLGAAALVGIATLGAVFTQIRDQLPAAQRKLFDAIFK